MSKKPAVTQVDIDDLIRDRWSPRAFDPEHIIEDEKLKALVEAAHWAPSCFNEQPWRYILCNKHKNETAWDNALFCLAPKNQLWAKSAPLLILACAYEEFTYNGKPNRWAQYDTGAASENICLQATSMGLFAHQMGGFDPERAHEVFHIPGNITPMAMIAAGYYGDINELDADFVEGENAERERKSVPEMFFNGDLKSPFVL